MYNSHDFQVKTSFFNFPKGRPVNDHKNIEMAEDFFKAAFNTDDVNVAFGKGPSGEPLLADMFVSARGPFVSLAALDSGVARLVGDILEGLADGKDVSGQLDELKSKASGGGSEEGEKKDDPFGKEKSEDKSEDKGSDPFSGGDLGSGSTPPAVGGPKTETDKPRLPFANDQRKRNFKKATEINRRYGLPIAAGMKLLANDPRNAYNIVKRASALKNEYGMDIGSSVTVVREALRSRDFDSFYKGASRVITDEQGKPLPAAEYVLMGAVAKGIDPETALQAYGESVGKVGSQQQNQNRGSGKQRISPRKR